MDQVRQYYEADTLLRTLDRRVRLLVSAVKACAMPYMPRVVDLYALDSVRELLDKPLDDYQDMVTAEDFTKALSDYDAVFADCNSWRKRQLLEALRTCKDPPASEPNEGHLELATSIFTCKSAYCRYHRPTFKNAGEMLAHRCTLESMHSLHGEGDWSVRDRQQSFDRVLKWVGDTGGSAGVAVNEVATSLAAHLVRRAGLNPETATFKNMDDADLWFECTCRLCRPETAAGRKGAFDWRQAVRNNLRDYLRFVTNSFHSAGCTYKSCRWHVSRPPQKLVSG
jgi:hypothetical protein